MLPPRNQTFRSILTCLCTEKQLDLWSSEPILWWSYFVVARAHFPHIYLNSKVSTRAHCRFCTLSWGEKYVYKSLISSSLLLLYGYKRKGRLKIRRFFYCLWILVDGLWVLVRELLLVFTCLSVIGRCFCTYRAPNVHVVVGGFHILGLKYVQYFIGWLVRLLESFCFWLNNGFLSLTCIWPGHKQSHLFFKHVKSFFFFLLVLLKKYMRNTGY